ILLGCESLRPPLTGIGNYTLQLLRQLQAHESIDEVVCIFAGRVHSSESLLQLFALPAPQVPPRTSAAHGGGAGYRLRTVLRRLPFTYPARSWMVSRRFAKEIRGYESFIYHEPNFIFQP